MTFSIGTKIRACADLVRMDLALGAGFFLVAGEILATNGMPPFHQVLPGFLTLFFISGSANISNDYFDREVDRVNQPKRPLPSGRVSVAQLWTLFFLFTAAGLAAATLLGSLVLVLAAAVWGIALLYNIKLKEMGLFGNLTVAFCVAMTVIIGGATIEMINGIVLTFAALAFLFDLGEEIAADAMDVIGDELRSSKSIARRKNKAYALRLSGAVFIIFIMLSFLPFMMDWLGYVYLLLMVVTDLCISYFSFRLLRSNTIEEGRAQIRRLYLTWGVFVAIFIFSNLI